MDDAFAVHVPDFDEPFASKYPCFETARCLKAMSQQCLRRVEKRRIEHVARESLVSRLMRVFGGRLCCAWRQHCVSAQWYAENLFAVCVCPKARHMLNVISR